MKTQLPTLIIILWVGLMGLAITSGVRSCRARVASNAPLPPPSLQSLPKGTPTDLSKDFVMGSPEAVSNALVHAAPPEGWDIVCDHQGHFAPRHNGWFVYDIPEANTVRTSRFEAIAAAWRMKLIQDQPQPPYKEPKRSGYLWSECKE